MPLLTIRAILRMGERTGPNYRKVSLKKKVLRIRIRKDPHFFESKDPNLQKNADANPDPGV